MPVEGRSPAAKRVLLVEISQDRTVGGSHQCLFDLARGLDRAAYTPVVLFYQRNPYVDRLRSLGIQVYAWDEERRIEKRVGHLPAVLGRLRSGWTVGGAVWRRLRLLRGERIDLVHMNNSPCHGYSDWLPAARLRRIPCVAHARGEYMAPGTRLGRWLTGRYDRVIAISEHIARNMRAAGIPAGRIRQVYDGIDLSCWSEAGRVAPETTRASLGISPSVMLVAMVGHLRRWKGQDVVLAALRLMEPDQRARLHVLFAGDAPQSDAEYQDALRRSVREGGLEQCVTFLGPRDDVPDLMYAADVILHASTIPEPLGLVVLEAMALGKAVVASVLGGPAETVTPASGILFDPARPGDLVAHLLALADSPDRRSTLGAGAKVRVQAFDLRRNVDGVQRIYAEVLGSAA